MNSTQIARVLVPTGIAAMAATATTALARRADGAGDHTKLLGVSAAAVGILGLGASIGAGYQANKAVHGAMELGHALGSMGRGAMYGAMLLPASLGTIALISVF